MLCHVCVGVALLTSVALSGDGQSLYIAGSSYDFFGLDAVTRLPKWPVDIQSRSAYMVEAKVSEPTNVPGVVYIIEVRNYMDNQDELVSCKALCPCSVAVMEKGILLTPMPYQHFVFSFNT